MAPNANTPALPESVVTSIDSSIENSPPVLTELLQLLAQYMKPEQIADVRRAYEFGAHAHSGQKRMSGEPYIHHPVSVAKILAEIRLDSPTIIAAILHDVIEDTKMAKEQLAKEFGDEVAKLVDGVSKLDQVQFKSKAEAFAASFRKMMLAMVDDIRVILIKLADRLHNMRTMGAMPLEKRRRIARETLEIYAPIAMRLGINTWRMEMQDLGFQILNPMRYRILAENVKKARGHRKEIVDKVEITVTARLEQENLPYQSIKTREKSLFSIYTKMRNRHVPYAEIMDLFALRVTVDTVDQCYRTLGVTHNIYKPVPGLFKDYIAMPKTNGYQALHTTLVGPHGIPIEVQIRTVEMNRFAESGIAAHWIYKSGEKPAVNTESRTQQWLQSVLEIQQKAGNSIEFLENVKMDLFPDEVYVFTPQGAIIELPRGGTVIDFAYAIHTDVGNHCMSARIDRRMVPLGTELENGQTVEIITHQAARPNPAWLNFVVTAKARSSIRHYLKNLTQEDSLRLGERMLNKALATYGVAIKDIPEKTLSMVLEEYKYVNLEMLLSDIGLGNRIPKLVARRIAPGEVSDEEKNALKPVKPLNIKGTEGLSVSYSRCCQPIPGDLIVGIVSAGRGVVIHRKNCKNIQEYKNHSDHRLDVEWEPDVGITFSTGLRIEVTNSRGALAQIATIISDVGCNIEKVSQEDKPGGVVSLAFMVAVKDRKMLAQVVRRIRHRKFVLKVSRQKG
ncbi:MAG: RelA/SpoT family protein [Gammaproteobacteria bacterium]|nr:RelA/SpoT family protein [Gammaproteobacteria bacterium]